MYVHYICAYIRYRLVDVALKLDIWLILRVRRIKQPTVDDFIDLYYLNLFLLSLVPLILSVVYQILYRYTVGRFANIDIYIYPLLLSRVWHPR